VGVEGGAMRQDFWKMMRDTQRMNTFIGKIKTVVFAYFIKLINKIVFIMWFLLPVLDNHS